MNNGEFKQEILLYAIIVIIIYNICKLYRRYEPSIDIIIRNNKYEVLLWYNNTSKENNSYESSKKDICKKRIYKRLF